MTPVELAPTPGDLVNECHLYCFVLNSPAQLLQPPACVFFGGVGGSHVRSSSFPAACSCTRPRHCPSPRPLPSHDVPEGAPLQHCHFCFQLCFRFHLPWDPLVFLEVQDTWRASLQHCISNESIFFYQLFSNFCIHL